MLRTDIAYAEWLINRALKKGEPRKMKRALNASLCRTRLCGEFERVPKIRKELRNVVRNMRRYRNWVAKEHPTAANVSIKITHTDDCNLCYK